MNIIQNLKTTNELLLFIINKHNISLSTLNDDGACIQDVIDNNNFLIDSGGWISVDDELPQENQEVLAVLKLSRLCVIVFLKNGDWYTDNDEKLIDGIAYWQPMPQPPKE